MHTPRDTTVSGKWNPLDFDCLYGCTYCPEKGKHSVKPKLRENWRNIPRDMAIWVPEDTDLFHPAVPSELISKVLKRAREVSHGYIFCTKNPERYKEFLYEFPNWSYLCVTIESDIDYKSSTAAPPLQRFKEMMEVKQMRDRKRTPSYKSVVEICVCIQPVMEFTPNFLELLVELAPDQISIGPEKCGFDTPQPSLREVCELAVDLKKRIPGIDVNVHGRTVYDASTPDSIIDPDIWNNAIYYQKVNQNT